MDEGREEGIGGADKGGSGKLVPFVVGRVPC